MPTSKAGAPLLQALVLFVLAASPAAHAEDKVPLPRYDIAAYCAAIELPGLSRDTCQTGEETKRVKLASEWDRYAFQKRHFCVTSIRFLPKVQRSYAALHSCLVEQGIS